ncbi:MAG: hypothetical protein ABI625_01375 [bacterium]
MNPRVRNLYVMLAAWPFGILCALVWLFLPDRGADPCPSGQACALHAVRVSLVQIIAWLAVAFGPGIIATRHWWRSCRPRGL